MPPGGRHVSGAGGACRCSEIAGAPDAVAAEVVAQARDAEQGRHQEQAGDEDHPPGVEQQGLVGQGQHAAPGKFVHRQAKAQEAEGGFHGDAGADGRDDHEEDGRDHIGHQMAAHDPAKAAAHAA